MTKSDLRLKVELLLKEFQKEHNLGDDEIHTIAITVMTLVYSDKQTRSIWYNEMRKTAELISNNFKNQADVILESLNLPEDEKKKLIESIRAKINKNKIEN